MAKIDKNVNVYVAKRKLIPFLKPQKELIKLSRLILVNLNLGVAFFLNISRDGTFIKRNKGEIIR